MRVVLFLCTGNYYRSRFAEIFFNWHARRQGLNWNAVSRGLDLDPMNVGNMSRLTRDRLRQHRIGFEEYERLPMDVSAHDLALADHIVAVKEAEHRSLLQRRFPECLNRVEFWHVHDIDCASPEFAMPQLEQHVLTLIERLTGASVAVSSG